MIEVDNIYLMTVHIEFKIVDKLMATELGIPTECLVVNNLNAYIYNKVFCISLSN